MRKLLTAIIVTIALLTSVTFFASCDNGSENSNSESLSVSEECQHSGGTATCIKKAVCEKCGEEYGELAEHVYGEWKKNAEKHWKECTTAGCTSKTEEAAHSFAKSGSDDENHWKECECGEKSEVTAHAFTKSESDDENHWKECECGKKTEINAHSLTDKHDDTQHWKECECDYKTEKVNHTLVKDNDNAQHWGKCECGYETTKESHVLTGKFDETQHWQACECGYTTEKENHATAYQHNDEQHWGECSCGYKAAKENHELTDESNETQHWKKCVCGYETEKVNHSYTVWDKTGSVYDYAACECGAKDLASAFDKSASLINQDLLVTKIDLALNIDGISGYTSVESITLGDYNLGTNVNAIVLPEELKADTRSHGKQTIIVTVKDSGNETHEIKVPVTLITKEISSGADFRTIQPSSETKGVYGYYLMSKDFEDTDLGKVAYAGDFELTTGFFGTFDGQGHTLTAAGNGKGIFGILRNATIKNLTIKDKWRTQSQYCSLLAYATYGTTIENVTFEWVNGSASTTAVGDGYGWISCREFSNNTVINVTINDSREWGSLFGAKFYDNEFGNLTVNGTYAEMGHTPDKLDEEGNVVEVGKSVMIDELTPIQQETVEKVKLTQRQDFVLNGKVSTIDLGEYEGGEILEIKTSTGYELYALKSDLTTNMFKNALQSHGEQDFIVLILLDGKKVEVTVPVTVITKEIATMSELYNAVKIVSETDSKYGYYVLLNDVSYTEDGFTFVTGKGNYESGAAFRGVLDGKGHSITTNTSQTSNGIFGTLNGAIVKNVVFKDLWAASWGYTPIIARNAYNTTFDNVTVEIVAGKSVSGTTDNTPIIGREMKNCVWKNSNIISAVDMVNVFAELTNNTFENVKIDANVTGGFSVTNPDYPDEVTFVSKEAA